MLAATMPLITKFENSLATQLFTACFNSKKNLHNSATTELGYYIVYTSGVKTAINNTWGASDYIALEANTSYLILGTTMQCALYDASKTYTRGLVTTGSYTVGQFKTSATEAYIRLSMRDTEVNNVKVIKKSGLLIVSPGGYGDYLTITGAVNGSVDGDTVLIMPGTYDESVNCNTKEIGIIGLNKRGCILTSTNPSYATPPLLMSKGYVGNLTINAAGTPTADGSYCIHIDATQSANKTLMVEDCILNSGNNSCLGIGLQPGFTLTVRNSIMNHTNATCVNGGVLVHNYTLGAGSNQKFIMDSCQIKSAAEIALKILDGSGATVSTAEVAFYNNIIHSLTTGVNSLLIANNSGACASFADTPDISLAVASAGNNIALLNAS